MLAPEGSQEIPEGTRGPDLVEASTKARYSEVSQGSCREAVVPVTRLNHAVMYVSDVRRSVAFYHEVLGFEPISMLPAGFTGAAFLKAPGSTNDHDLGLFEIGASARASQAGHGQVGLYHLAWEVDTLGELQATAQRLAAAGA